MIVYLQTLTIFHEVQSSLKYLLFAVGLTIILPSAAWATEPDNQTPVNNQQEQEAPESKEDSVVSYADEYKVNDPFMLEDQVILSQEAVTPERTAPVRTYQKPAKEETAAQPDESNSAMSFNFIYYIIDKFKLADPMD